MTPVNLLVIEDDAVSLKLLEVYLKNDRHNIILARDGQEASDTLMPIGIMHSALQV